MINYAKCLRTNIRWMYFNEYLILDNVSNIIIICIFVVLEKKREYFLIVIYHILSDGNNLY